MRPTAPGNAATVAERRDKERVDAGVVLKTVKHGRDAFIDERDSAYLNADHPLRRLQLRQLRSNARGSHHFCEFASGNFGHKSHS